MKRWLIVCLLGCCLGLGAQMRSVEISRLLAWGPLDISATEAALFADGDAIMDYPFLTLRGLQPLEGAVLEWSPRIKLPWTRLDSPSFNAGLRPQVVYWAVYLEVSRWLQAELAIDDAPPLRLYLDGKMQKCQCTGKHVTSTLTLASGKHLLVGQFLLHAAAPMLFRPRWFLAASDKLAADVWSVSLSPARHIAAADVLDQRQATSLALSQDGELLAVFFRKQSAPPEAEKQPRRWLEILSGRDGRCLYRFADMSEAFAWVRDSHAFVFARREGEKTAIGIYSLADQQERIVCRGIENFSSFWLSGSGRYLIYGREQSEADSERGFKFVRDIPDRSRTPRLRQSLTLLWLADGVRHPLADERENYSDVSIAPDGSKILLAKTEEDPQHRPYSRRIFTLVEATSLQKEKLLEDPWLNSADWSPDSKQLLLLGGPSAFNGLGRSLPVDLTANEFDIQAYLYDLASRKPQALTRLFNPSIESAFWSPADRQIYFKVTDQDCHRIYRYAPQARTFKKLELPLDVMPLLSFSDRHSAAIWGSAPNLPPKLYSLDLAASTLRLLADVNREQFAQVRWGRVSRESLAIGPKRSVLGTLYYPPDFRAGKKYPCIVNFYGGTTPVLREFGGRYPKEWYAANGYLVLVLQPQGCIGFGQESSACHVNDWGEISAQEIIAAVAEFVRTHPEADAQRLGAIGASYGGFLTQYLATLDRHFAAYVSHAGISSLASYWGVGDWGYSYSAVASADSFPWNRKDIYAGHSPLFLAERINRPLLLLHGDADNNVPPGESDQMFAALKLLGKEVALVTFAGQQHFILDPEKRLRWMDTIMAWFDKWLKGQPEWWDDLYPPRAK